MRGTEAAQTLFHCRIVSQFALQIEAVLPALVCSVRVAEVCLEGRQCLQALALDHEVATFPCRLQALFHVQQPLCRQRTRLSHTHQTLHLKGLIRVAAHNFKRPPDLLLSLFLVTMPTPGQTLRSCALGLANLMESGRHAMGQKRGGFRAEGLGRN